MNTASQTGLLLKLRAMRQQLDLVVSGYDEIKDMIIVALLADGHVLLEAVPGTAKTTLVSTLTHIVDQARSTRLQLTPDHKPSDITGVEIYHQGRHEFVTKLGPILDANLVLADEINRTSPKTLSALLECMQERRVTISDTTHNTPRLFIIIATENPVESEGVFVLPEATLDRFMIKLPMGYVSRQDEVRMLRNTKVHGRDAHTSVRPVISIDELLELQALVGEMCDRASAPLLEYIVDLTRATRPGKSALEVREFDAVHGEDAEALRDQIAFGASPRCEIATLHCAAALAVFSGATHIEPAHVKRVFHAVANHRIIIKDSALYDGVTTTQVIEKVLQRVAIVSPSSS